MILICIFIIYTVKKTTIKIFFIVTYKNTSVLFNKPASVECQTTFHYPKSENVREMKTEKHFLAFLKESTGCFKTICLLERNIFDLQR